MAHRTPPQEHPSEQLTARGTELRSSAAAARQRIQRNLDDYNIYLGLPEQVPYTPHHTPNLRTRPPNPNSHARSLMTRASSDDSMVDSDFDADGATDGQTEESAGPDDRDVDDSPPPASEESDDTEALLAIMRDPEAAVRRQMQNTQWSPNLFEESPGIALPAPRNLSRGHSFSLESSELSSESSMHELILSPSVRGRNAIDLEGVRGDPPVEASNESPETLTSPSAPVAVVMTSKDGIVSPLASPFFAGNSATSATNMVTERRPPRAIGHRVSPSGELRSMESSASSNSGWLRRSLSTGNLHASNSSPGNNHYDDPTITTLRRYESSMPSLYDDDEEAGSGLDQEAEPSPSASTSTFSPVGRVYGSFSYDADHSSATESTVLAEKNPNRHPALVRRLGRNPSPSFPTPLVQAPKVSQMSPSGYSADESSYSSSTVSTIVQTRRPRLPSDLRRDTQAAHGDPTQRREHAMHAVILLAAQGGQERRCRMERQGADLQTHRERMEPVHEQLSRNFHAVEVARHEHTANEKEAIAEWETVVEDVRRLYLSRGASAPGVAELDVILQDLRFLFEPPDAPPDVAEFGAVVDDDCRLVLSRGSTAPGVAELDVILQDLRFLFEPPDAPPDVAEFGAVVDDDRRHVLARGAWAVAELDVILQDIRFLFEPAVNEDGPGADKSDGMEADLPHQDEHPAILAAVGADLLEIGSTVFGWFTSRASN